MTRLRILRQRAAERRIWVLRSYSGKAWDVIVDSEGMLGPRGLEYSKRNAINLAYSISISKKSKLEITYS